MPPTTTSHDYGPLLPRQIPSAIMDEHDEKTVALITTCSMMLSIALILRLVHFYVMQKTRRNRCHRVYFFPRSYSTLSLSFPLVLYTLDVSFFLILWYGVSITMTLFNKWFLRVWASGGYPFATTMTCINMFIKCLLSRLFHRCTSSSHPDVMMALPSRIYWKVAVPIGVCTALDIMLSNLSLCYITVTFYTIVKSGGNVWNLVFSICMGHQRPSWSLVGVIVLISSGIGLASYGSAHFVLSGFLLVLTASVMGTLRWVLTQSLLQSMEDKNGAIKNKVLAVVYYVSPASAIGLLPIALFTEGREYTTSRFVLDSQLLMLSLIFIFISGCLAFVLIFIEILLVKKTSALSLGIAGSFKDVTQVLLAVFIFGDQLIAINVFGLVVATCGMLFYTFIKHTSANVTSDSRDGNSKGYQRVPTSTVDLKEDRAMSLSVATTGKKALYSVYGVELVRRESNEYYIAPGSVAHV